uniref:Uncharacterized protein n=1 Tax=Arion vulgaris TaxID=1028688 RepID=A0A0B6ZQL6_9EUPU
MVWSHLLLSMLLFSRAYSERLRRAEIDKVAEISEEVWADNSQCFFCARTRRHKWNEHADRLAGIATLESR